MPGDPNRIVKVFRPESAVSCPIAIESFRNVPLINDHAMLSGFEGDKENAAPEDYGVSGVLTSNVYYEAPWMRGDIKIFSRNMKALLDSGKEDLSLGYSCDFEQKPGVWRGIAYEILQTNLRGNHIALVKSGRVSGARVLDGLCFDHLSFDIIPSERNYDMTIKSRMSKTARDSAVETLQVLVPKLASALESLLAEEVQEPQHQADPADPADTQAATPSDPAATPPSTADPATDDLAAQIEGNSAAAAAADPNAAGGEEPNVVEGEGQKDLGAILEQAKALIASLEAACQEDPNAQTQTQDNVEGLEGLQNSQQQGAQVAVDTDTEAAAAATAAGLPSKALDTEPTETPEALAAKAQDAALRGFYADSALKDSIYDRLSAIVGAFNHKAMDSRAVMVYGVKKLGIKCADGMEGLALNTYLDAADKATADAKLLLKKKVGDSAVATSDEMDKYLAGGQ